MLISCQEFLEENPKAIAVSTFYNTANEIKAGVNAIFKDYATGGSSFKEVFGPYLDSFADNLWGKGSYIVDYQQLTSTQITRSDGFWQFLYLAIRDANLIIKYAPNANDCSQEDIAKYVGEAKFMRALSYFYLVRMYGGVPIKTEENMEVTDVPRATENEVWQLIISDLENAEENLPDKASDVGRPSKWVAKTVLADVYFYKGEYSKASANAKEVIQSGMYSLVQVSSWGDFDSKLYGVNVVNSSEEIFYIKFTSASTSTQSIFFIYYHVASSPYSGGRGYSAVKIPAASNYYKNWNSQDIRKDLLYKSGTADYLSRKYIDTSISKGADSGIDWPLYRYSDILLLYAEASCRASNGPTADGLEALNQVHRRAYGKDPTQPSSVDFKLTDYNSDSFNELIIKERGYETLCEGKRWFDLKRLNKVAEYVYAEKGITINRNVLLWPIPVAEMSFNKAIDPATDQNPGY